MRLALTAVNVCLKTLPNTNEVIVPWTGQNSIWWNEACAQVLEVFGLPGDKYTYHPTIEHMVFLFKSEKDAILCKILLSERL